MKIKFKLDSRILNKNYFLIRNDKFYNLIYSFNHLLNSIKIYLLFLRNVSSIKIWHPPKLLYLNKLGFRF